MTELEAQVIVGSKYKQMPFTYDLPYLIEGLEEGKMKEAMKCLWESRSK